MEKIRMNDFYGTPFTIVRDKERHCIVGCIFDISIVLDRPKLNNFIKYLNKAKNEMESEDHKNKLIHKIKNETNLYATLSELYTQLESTILININKELKNKGLKSKLSMQIQDTFVFDVKPEEEEQFIEIIKNNRLLTQKRNSKHQ